MIRQRLIANCHLRMDGHFTRDKRTLSCSELQHQVHQRWVDFLMDHNQDGAALVQSMAFYPVYPGSSNQPI